MRKRSTSRTCYTTYKFLVTLTKEAQALQSGLGQQVGLHETLCQGLLEPTSCLPF